MSFLRSSLPVEGRRRFRAAGLKLDAIVAMFDASTRILVTGGAGFIGSAFVRAVITETAASIVNVDKLTYAGTLASVQAVADSPRYRFEHVDIRDGAALADIFHRHRPTAIIHFAAETHVDRSIDGPADFIQTNVVGTYMLLEIARQYWSELDAETKARFRFLHVSTDEVFGALGADGKFTGATPYRPNSPYAASKAAADHLVRAWRETYGLPTIITNCSNNYGPFQFPEKLIPLMIGRALAGKPLPVYGKGENVRDWLYVEDHVRALMLVLTKGCVGETYLVGGSAECSNIALVHMLCTVLDEMRPRSAGRYAELISFVADRPGHDFRYAIDSRKIMSTLGWIPRESLDSGLRRTVRWYIENQHWCEDIRRRVYGGARLGVAARSTAEQEAVIQ